MVITTKPRFSFYVEVQPTDPYEAVALFEKIQPGSIAFIELPETVYIGTGCVILKNVNIDFCEENNISIVRGILAGKGLFYRLGDSLWVILSSKTRIMPSALQSLLVRSFRNLGLEAFLFDNDIRIGNRRIAMTASEVQMDDKYIIGAEIIFDADFDLVKKAMKFPRGKWDNKPVSRIEDWILTMDELGISKEEVKKAFLNQIEKQFGIKPQKRGLLKSEDVSMNLLVKYKSDRWIKEP